MRSVCPGGWLIKSPVSSPCPPVALVAGSAPFDPQDLLDALGPKRGILYFYLLLARLDARGEIGRASFEN